MSNQLAGLLFKILKAYGVSITYSSIEKEVRLHPPEYPSIILYILNRYAKRKKSKLIELYYMSDRKIYLIQEIKNQHVKFITLLPLILSRVCAKHF